MSQIDRPAGESDDARDPEDFGDEIESRGEAFVPRAPRGEGGFLAQYKPEQGKRVRMGTFVCLAALAAWGAKYLYDRLVLYEGDSWWTLLITVGIPIAYGCVFAGIAWWACYSHPKAGDFMIATEGEMKKVSWSSRREVIGSTKVVIVVMLLLGLAIFVIDFLFQTFFRSIGVLRV